jgi:hypothetical protein
MCLFACSSRTICTKYGMHIPWGQKENIGGSKLRKKVFWVRLLVRAFPVARKLSTIEEWLLNKSCLFRRRDYRNEDQNPEKLSWVRFPVKMVSVVRILRTTEEQRRDQSCFAEEITETNATTRKTVLDSSPDGVFCSSKTKHKRRTAPRQNLFVSERRLQEISHKPENCPGF